MAASSLTGKSLGNYRDLVEVGRGGMGVVYRARQPSLNRYVALKVLPSYFAHDEEFVVRFQREGWASAQLLHPNIVHIYDMGQAEGLYYIAMEYLEGQTLAQLIAQEGRLHPGRAARIVDQIAQALDHAHQQGVVHRDVKPANIFVGPGDHVTLTDFGIAKAAWETVHLTRTGVLIGSPPYMAPEQVEAGHVDHRTDLYALGAVLYQMLTGQVPFQGTLPHATIHKLIYEAPTPPRQLNPKLTPAIESVLVKALAKQPNDRFQSGRSLSEAYRRALSGAVVRTPQPVVRATKPQGAARHATRRLVIGLSLAAAVLVLALAVLVTAQFLLPKAPPPTREPAGAASGTPVALVAPGATETALQATLQVVAATTQEQSSRLTATGIAEVQEQERQEATAQAAQRQHTQTAAVGATEYAQAATRSADGAMQEARAATQTAEARPTAPPPNTLVPPPTCALQADPQLAGVWDRSLLGCPVAGANTVWAAWQPFERGYMWWRSDNDKVYVLYLLNGNDPNAGHWWEDPTSIEVGWQQSQRRWDEPAARPAGAGPRFRLALARTPGRPVQRGGLGPRGREGFLCYAANLRARPGLSQQHGRVLRGSTVQLGHPPLLHAAILCPVQR